MLLSTGPSLVCNDNQTHIRMIKVRNWRKKPKVLNLVLIYFHSKIIGNVENKNNSPVNIKFATKTSDVRNFPQNIRSAVKTLEVATLWHIGQFWRPPSILCKSLTIQHQLQQMDICFQLSYDELHDGSATGTLQAYNLSHLGIKMPQVNCMFKYDRFVCWGALLKRIWRCLHANVKYVSSLIINQSWYRKPS